MQIKQVKLSEIKPYENNPRFNDDAVDAVAESIQQFGFKVPIVLDKNGVIVTGHTRYKAAKAMSMEEVPCIYADDLTDDQVKAFRIADNKVGEIATWDMEKLEKELLDIDIDMSEFGFDINAEEEITPIEDDFEEYPEKLTKVGQLWQLGRHFLKVGDSTNPSDLEDLVGGVEIDLLLTDPPYNVDIGSQVRPGESKNNIHIKNDHMNDDDFEKFLTKCLNNASTKMKAGAAYYIFYASSHHIEFENAVRNIPEFNLHEQLIWVKDSIVLGINTDYQWMHEPCLYGWKKGAEHYFTNSRSEATVIEDSNVKLSTLKKNELIELCEKLMGMDQPQSVIRAGKSIGEVNHPTIKPQDLLCYLMKNSSRKSEKVLDLFGGSGSTLIAAEQLGRTCYMMELDEHFADVIIERYIKFKGSDADVFLKDGDKQIPYAEYKIN